MAAFMPSLARLSARLQEMSHRGVSFDFKVGQIGPKWDKSGNFSDQISVHFGSAKCTEISSEKMCPICGQSGPLLGQICHP